MLRFKEHLREEMLNEAITVSSLRKLYKDFNKKFFKNSLPEIKIEFKSMKRAMGFVAASRDTKSGNIRIERMSINSSIKLTTEMLEKTMLHEMIHVFMFHNGMFTEGHGSNFQAMRRTLSQRSGLDIPETEDSKELGVFDKSKPKKIFVLLIDGGSDKQFSMLLSIKGAADTIRDLKNPENGSRFTSNADLFKRFSIRLMKKIGAKSARFGIVDTYLYKKLPVKRSLSKISMQSINDEEFKHLTRELDKNIDGITTAVS